MKTSVIVPAYNEEGRIETVILNYANSFPDAEIIVVCDGTDNTKNIIRKKSKKYPNIKLLSFEKKLGKGGGIIEGFKAAIGE